MFLFYFTIKLQSNNSVVKASQGKDLNSKVFNLLLVNYTYGNKFDFYFEIYKGYGLEFLWISLILTDKLTMNFS
jgi:hypothetical protein